MSATISVNIPLKIVEKIIEDIKGTSVKSVEAFIKGLVLQKYPELNEPVYTEEEEELIKERLRKLGYL